MLTRLLKNALLISATLCLLTLTAVFYQAACTARATRATVESLTATVEDSHQQMLKLTKTANTVLFQWSEASNAIRHASEDQRIALQKTNQEVLALLANADRTVHSVNRTTDNLNAQLTGISTGTQQALSQLSVTLEHSQQTLDAATEATKTVNQVVSNPAIPATLAHVDQTMGHVEAITALGQKQLEIWTRPKKLAARIFSWTLDTAAKAATILK